MNLFKNILFLLSIAVVGALASENPMCAGMDAGSKAYQENDFERARALFRCPYATGSFRASHNPYP